MDQISPWITMSSFHHHLSSLVIKWKMKTDKTTAACRQWSECKRPHQAQLHHFWPELKDPRCRPVRKYLTERPVLLTVLYILNWSLDLASKMWDADTEGPSSRGGTVSSRKSLKRKAYNSLLLFTWNHQRNLSNGEYKNIINKFSKKTNLNTKMTASIVKKTQTLKRWKRVLQYPFTHTHGHMLPYMYTKASLCFVFHFVTLSFGWNEKNHSKKQQILCKINRHFQKIYSNQQNLHRQRDKLVLT